MTGHMFLSKNNTQSSLPISGNTQTKRLNSTATSSDVRKARVSYWMEWSDNDINSEKWEFSGKEKTKEKGKSPVTQVHFEDPEGKVILPPSLCVTHWKRPPEYFQDKIPVVIDPESTFTVDFSTANDAILYSETIRWLISGIEGLWQIHQSPATGLEVANEVPVSPNGIAYHWRPWEHIHTLSKIVRGPHIPNYNQFGKYAVKLYWMGCWRKIIVDDTLPFDENDNLLLPATSKPQLWPLLLSKALLKVASLDYLGKSASTVGKSELGDFSVVHCLTGWLPQAVTVKKDCKDMVWTLLESLLPPWTYPAENEAKLPVIDIEEIRSRSSRNRLAPGSAAGSHSTLMGVGTKKSRSGMNPPVAGGKQVAAGGAEPASRMSREHTGVSHAKSASRSSTSMSQATDKDDKDPQRTNKAEKSRRDKEGKRLDEPSSLVPEVAVFACFNNPGRSHQNFSMLTVTDMLERQEKLRTERLSLSLSHPILLSHTRTIPLTKPPPPPELGPAWKRIRPKPSWPTLLPGGELVSSRSPSLVPPGSNQSGGTSRGGEGDKAIRSLQLLSPFIGCAEIKDITKKLAADRKEDVETAVLPPVEDNTTASSVQVSSNDPASHQRPHDDRLPGIPECSSVRGNDTPQTLEDSLYLDHAPRFLTPLINEDVEEEEGPTGDVTVADLMEGQVKEEERTGTSHPSSPTLAPDTEQEDDSIHKTSGVKSKNIWMDAEKFCDLFDTLYIYHKVNTYPFHKTFTDYKPLGVEVPRTQYLFVDSVDSTDIIICLSTICRWNETLLPQPQSRMSSEGRKSTARTRKSVEEIESTIPLAPELPQPTEPPDVQPGSLVMERYRWRTPRQGEPLLSFSSRGVRVRRLAVPPGRHCIRMRARAPLHYYVTIVSKSSIRLVDEERLLSTRLTSPPARLVEFATQLGRALCARLAGFPQIDRQFLELDRLLQGQDRLKRQAYLNCLYATLRQFLGEALDPDMLFAWRVLNSDIQTRDPFGMQYAPLQVDPVLSQAWCDRIETMEDGMPAVLDLQARARGHFIRNILNEAWWPESTSCQRVIASCQRSLSYLESQPDQLGLGLINRLLRCEPTMLVHLPLNTDLMEYVNCTEYTGGYPAEAATNSWCLVFRHVFLMDGEDTSDRGLLVLPKFLTNPPLANCCLVIIDNDTGREVDRGRADCFPGQHISPNRLGYTFLVSARSGDQPQPAGRWRLLLVGEATSATNSQLPRAAAPLLTAGSQPPGARGNDPPSVSCASNFHVVKFRGYYHPPRETYDLHGDAVDSKMFLLFRFQAKLTGAEDVLATLDLHVSQPGANLELRVLQDGLPICRVRGRSQVQLGAVMFRRVEVRRSSPPPANTTSTASSNTTGGSSRTGARTGPGTARRKMEKRGSSSQLSRESSTTSGTGTDEVLQHRYIIEALVDKHTWPLTVANRSFVDALLQQEREDRKLSAKHVVSDLSGLTSSDIKRDGSLAAVGIGGRGSSKSWQTARSTKEKTSAPVKDTRPGHGGSSSRPDSCNFDPTKAHWTLRIFYDADKVEGLVVTKDTERADQIRVMKRAWENVDPGRAERARLARQGYLSTHLVPMEEVRDPLHPLRASVPLPDRPEGGVLLPQLDIESLRRGDPNRAVFLDIRSRELSLSNDRQLEMAAFTDWLSGWERWREEERRSRNWAKVKQIELAYRLQTLVDKSRAAYFRNRESYRTRLLVEASRAAAMLIQRPAIEEGDPNLTNGNATTVVMGGLKGPDAEVVVTQGKGTRKR